MPHAGWTGNVHADPPEGMPMTTTRMSGLPGAARRAPDSKPDTPSPHTLSQGPSVLAIR